MRVMQWLLVCGLLGLALWGLGALYPYAYSNPTGRSSLYEAMRANSAASGDADDLKVEDEEPITSDHFEQNPFPLAKGKAGPRPKLVAPETTYKFERMPLGSKGKHDFVIRNEGDAPLKIAKGPTMCKCTLSQVREQEVPPGGEVVVGLEWEPTATGPFNQSAVVWTNDAETPRLELTISGDMFANVVINPPAGWVLGSTPVGTELPFEGYVHSSIMEDLQIVELRSESEQVEITFEEIEPQDVPTAELEFDEETGPADSKILKAYRLSGKVLASEQAGPLSTFVVLKTSEADAAENRLPLRVTRTGPISLLGSGWFAEQQLLRLGRVNSREGVSKKLALMIDAFPEDLQLNNVQTGLSFLTLELDRERADPTAAKHRYSLWVKVAPNAPLGEWTGPKRALISFETNHPKVPRFEIHAEFEIL